MEGAWRAGIVWRGEGGSQLCILVLKKKNKKRTNFVAGDWDSAYVDVPGGGLSCSASGPVTQIFFSHTHTVIAHLEEIDMALSRSRITPEFKLYACARCSRTLRMRVM